MNQASRTPSAPRESGAPIERKPARDRLPIVVRLKYGEELAGMRLHEDGLAFHAPTPMPVGQVVELILCGGSILVDAEIVECESLIDGLGGFMIRARYHQASAEVRELIAEELRPHMPPEVPRRNA